ncbi:hypothetical protein L6164_009519 [Bauhinia variegata]|uniref:Uncharacterized protein n=1 Tax=Bauhinia variegata TaxID=167791 RepID=A0ACB9PLL8_BAUVA|nr:hypothetical protein L6164_009519 [Bauhinia variegata]
MSSRELFLRQASSNRQQSFLESPSYCSSTNVGEFVGSTAAECAAVCCCVPCAVANFLVLAIYKVPAGLCRRALRKKRLQRLAKKGLMSPRRRAYSFNHDEDFQIYPLNDDSLLDIKSDKSQELDKEAEELEKEMWQRFYGTGFFRSPSQRESSAASSRNLTNVKPLSNLNQVSY